MISLVLFSIVIAGVFSVAVSTTVGFRDQRDLVVTETSVRAPMEFMADAIRNASPATQTGVIQDAYTCQNGAINVVNSSTAPDVLEIVYAAGAVATTISQDSYDLPSPLTPTIMVGNVRQFAVGDTVLITDNTKGHLLKITAINAGARQLTLASPTCATTSVSYGPGAFVIRAARARFFVCNASPPISVPCPDGIPTLMVDPDGIGPAAAEPLAENIEDMQIALGVDANGDKGIDDPAEWQHSATVGALAGPIRAIRVTLVARAPRGLPGPPTFAHVPAEDRNAATDGAWIGATDNFRRRVLTSTIEIRNLGGSP
ncbi:MAG: PilW family protein [Deltaproteobacteria bacterium]|nr:PilW family protein [Deltaproteobacteria bacterium]